ncbi:hypothetical protein QE400_003493 [Xanthomonas sacchari]|nr:hypothetical protein [Xanthomonas sacchari]
MCRNAAGTVGGVAWNDSVPAPDTAVSRAIGQRQSAQICANTRSKFAPSTFSATRAL